MYVGSHLEGPPFSWFSPLNDRLQDPKEKDPHYWETMSKYLSEIFLSIYKDFMDIHLPTHLTRMAGAFMGCVINMGHGGTPVETTPHRDVKESHSSSWYMTCKWNNLRGRGRCWFFPFDKGIGSGSDSIEFRGLHRIRRGKVATCALFTVRAVGSSRSPQGRLPNTGLRFGDPATKW